MRPPRSEICLIPLYLIRPCGQNRSNPAPATGRRRLAEPLIKLDLNVHSGRQFKFHQRIYGLVGRIDDIHQSLVRTDFVLIASILVDVRRDQDRIALHLHRERYRALDRRASALRGVHDLASRIVDQTMIERFQPDSNILVSCHVVYFLVLYSISAPTIIVAIALFEQKRSCRRGESAQI